MIQPVFGFSNQLSILYTKKNPKISRNCDCMNLIVDLLGSATKIHLTSKANISTFPEFGCITSSTRPKGLPGAKRESNSKKPCCANQMSRARWVAQPIGVCKLRGIHLSFHIFNHEVADNFLHNFI